MRGSGCQKNASIWSTFSKNCLKTPFLAYFFKSLVSLQLFGRTKTKVDKIFEFLNDFVMNDNVKCGEKRKFYDLFGKF